jgi:hypothetical protein
MLNYQRVLEKNIQTSISHIFLDEFPTSVIKHSNLKNGAGPQNVSRRPAPKENHPFLNAS